MPVMVKKPKWILYKHNCDFSGIKEFALILKNKCKTCISEEERYKMQEYLAELNLYKTRSPKLRPLDSMAHKINTLEYWMLGYEYKENNSKRFMFGPLGNLFLKYINDEEKQQKIFLTM
jgi:type II restriction enzyme